jgi:hypothetical protein
MSFDEDFKIGFPMSLKEIFGISFIFGVNHQLSFS